MEIITSTLLYLVDNIFSSWLGNKTEHYLEKVSAFVSQLKDTEKPVNHDLQKAIASSHWLATKVFCEKLKKNNPPDILEGVLRVIRKKLKEINREDYCLPANNTPDSYEADLMILKENRKEALEVLKQKVITHHIKELKSRLKEREANSVGFETLENAIRNGLLDENLNWFDLVCAFLNELLKGNSKAKDTFQNQELTKIGLEMQELKMYLESFTHDSVTKIGEEPFEELKSLVHDELEEIKNKLNEIKTGIDTANDKLDRFGKELSRLNPTLQYAQKLTPIPELGIFIGRDEDLAELSQILATANQVVLMNGMGGIGKTTLARAYVNQNLSDFNYIAWISVTSDNVKEAFVNTEYFNEALQTAKLKEGDNNVRFISIMQTINNLQGSGLLVIDNAEKDVEEIKKFLPPPPQWQILLTSRLELKAFDTIIKIDKLSEPNAEIVFKKYYNKPINEQDYPIFKSLLEEIDYHTLTIELIAKTMRESDNNLRFAEVLEKLQQRQLDNKRMRELIHVRHFDDDKAVLYNHLIATFNLSKLSDYEIWVLKQFTALPPEPIQKDTLIEWLTLDENKSIEFEQALKVLKNKGWLKRMEDIEGYAQYTIHRLIQDMVHYQYGISFEDIEVLINTFKELLNFDSSTDFSLKFQYLPIAEYIVDSLPKDSKNTGIASLNNNLGVNYRNFSDLFKAQKYLLKALEISKKQANAKAIAISSSNLALVYQDLGNYQQAKDLLELALKFNIKNFGHNGPNTAGCLSNLALVNRNLKNYEQAKKLLELALKINKKKFGENHPTISATQSILAMVNQDLGNYQEAKNLSESALTSDLKKFGNEHTKVATRQLNLAVTLIRLGNLQEAKQLLESAYNTLRTRLGENHPNTKSCLSWLNHVNEKLY